MDSMCRLCLITANGEDIFENGFDKVIEASFGIKLKIIANWPSHACETCLSYLNGLKEFKAMIEGSQNHLEKLESQVVVETETIIKIYEDLEELFEISDLSSLPESSRSNSKPEGTPPLKRTNVVYKGEQSATSTIVPEKPEETPPAKKAKRVAEKERTPREIIPEKSPTTENLKSKSPASSPIISSRKSKADKSNRLEELRAPLEAQLKKMNLLRCNKCQFEANTWKELQMHYRDQHQTEGYVTCCNNKFIWGAIYAHMEYHLDENRFKCEICDKKMKSNLALRQHRNISHVKEDCKFKCETCGKPFNTLAHLKQHFKSHQNLFEICEICGKEVSNVANLRNHINLCHTDRKTEECDICGKQFLNVKCHKYKVHNINNTANVLMKCEYCGKDIRKFSYNLHVNTVHLNDGKVYKCSICGKEIKDARSYKKHMDMHAGVVYDCYFCEHQSSCKSSLHTHMKAKHVEEYAEFKKMELTKVRIKLASTDVPNSSKSDM